MGLRVIVEGVSPSTLADVLDSEDEYRKGLLRIVQRDHLIRVEDGNGLGVQVGVVTPGPGAFSGARIDMEAPCYCEAAGRFLDHLIKAHN